MLGTSNLGSWNGHWLSQILQISIDEFPIFSHEKHMKKAPRQAWESQWRPVVCETLPGAWMGRRWGESPLTISKGPSPMSWNQFPGKKICATFTPKNVFIVSKYLVWQFRCGSRHFWCLYLVTGGTEYRIRAHFKCNQHPPAEFQDVL
jgi:hypothetical protein